MALGKIKADTLEHSTAGSLDTKFVVNGSAKAFHGYGDQSAGALNANSQTLNISTYEDTATGRSRLNMTNAMSVALGYMVVGSTQAYDYGYFAVTASQYEAGSINGSGNFADGITHTLVMGDLA